MFQNVSRFFRSIGLGVRSSGRRHGECPARLSQDLCHLEQTSISCGIAVVLILRPEYFFGSVGF